MIALLLALFIAAAVWAVLAVLAALFVAGGTHQVTPRPAHRSRGRKT